MSFLNSFRFYSSQLENVTAAKIARFLLNTMDFPHGSDGKESTCNAGDPSSSLGWEDPLKKEMATDSSSLAWRISWTEEPGELKSMGSQRAGHD